MEKRERKLRDENMPGSFIKCQNEFDEKLSKINSYDENLLEALILFGEKVEKRVIGLSLTEKDIKLIESQESKEIGYYFSIFNLDVGILIDKYVKVKLKKYAYTVNELKNIQRLFLVFKEEINKWRDENIVDEYNQLLKKEEIHLQFSHYDNYDIINDVHNDTFWIEFL